MLILDRDGVINEDSPHYIRSPAEWIPIESSLKAIAACNHADIPVVVATNQSGIGRGYYSDAVLQAIHLKMKESLSAVGGWVDGIYYCPHHPDDGCDCRKPRTGMLKAIARDFPDDMHRACMVGDSWSDWQVATSAGVTPYLVRTGKGAMTYAEHQQAISSDACFANLAVCVTRCLGVPGLEEI